MTPKIGDYILWKRFGFRHIIKDEDTTLCGQKYGWMIRRYEAWSKADSIRAREATDPAVAKHFTEQAFTWRERIKYNNDTQHRPTCGTCAKIHAKIRRNNATD